MRWAKAGSQKSYASELTRRWKYQGKKPLTRLCAAATIAIAST
jgi:hypothetical protein